MINELTTLIRASRKCYTEENVLCCEYIVEDTALIQQLSDEALLLNRLPDNIRNGDTLLLEFSFSSLFPKGVYESRESFLKKHYYQYPSKAVYICETGLYLTEDFSFHTTYSVLIDFMKSLKSAAHYAYFEEEVQHLLLVREEMALPLPLQYNIADLDTLKETELGLLRDVTNLLRNEASRDKQHLFINEMVHYLRPVKTAARFSFLLQTFSDYYTRATAAYNYYLRHFSYHKLKLEMDTKALDFSQKLQAVINDIQHKLIVIPSAFVLVVTTFIINRNRLFYVNIFSFTGFLIFCAYFQIFIANQRSLLKIIRTHIDSYLHTFQDTAFRELRTSFSRVYEEHDKQSFRLFLVNMIMVLTIIVSLTCLICLWYDSNFFT